VKANLRVIRRAAASEKQPEPREVRLTIKKEQAAALGELQRAINELQGRVTAMLVGIVGGHGIAEFQSPKLEGLRLTVIDHTAVAEWRAAHPEPNGKAPEPNGKG
jgi:hypothetical protein